MTTCPVCGAEVQPNQRFCSQCGSRLTSAPGSEERNAVPRRPGGGKPDPYGVGAVDDDDFFSQFRPKSAVSDDEQVPPPASSRRRFNPMFTGEQDVRSAEADKAERVTQSERRSAAQKAEAERRARRRAENERADAQRRQTEEARKAAAARAAERAEYARLEAERAAQAQRDAEAQSARAEEEERRALDQDPEPAANDMPALPSPFGHFTKRSAPSIPAKDWSDEDAPPTARMTPAQLRAEVDASTPTVDDDDREVEIPSWFADLADDEPEDAPPARPARQPFSAGAAGTGESNDREDETSVPEDESEPLPASRDSRDDGATFTQLIEGLDNDPADAPISSPGVGDTGVVPLPTEHLSDEEQARHDRAAALFGGAAAAGAAVAGAAALDDDADEATVLGGHDAVTRADIDANSSVSPDHTDAAAPSQSESPFDRGAVEDSSDASDDDLDRFFAQAGLGGMVGDDDEPAAESAAMAASPRSNVGGWFNKLGDRVGIRSRGADASDEQSATPAFADDSHDDDAALAAGSGARGHARDDIDASEPTTGNWFTKLTAAGAAGAAASGAAGSAAGASAGHGAGGASEGPENVAATADDDETRRKGVRTIAIAAAAAVVLILGTFLTVNLFGGHDDAPVAESPAASQPSETAAEPEPTETPTQQAPATFEPTSFASESGNIRCQITSESGVACQMMDRDFSLPEQECVGPNYSGIAVGVNADGVTWPCLSGDLSADRAVAYDEPVKAGEFTCTINFETGVTCANGKGDGFTMEYENGVQTKGAVIASPNVDVTVN